MQIIGQLGARRVLRAGLLTAVTLGAISMIAQSASASESEAERNARFEQAAGVPAGAKNKKEAPIKVGGTPTTATEIVAGQNQAPMLQTNSEQLLQIAQQKYSAIVAQGGFPQVPAGTYKKGATNQAVGILNKRLFIEGYLRVEGTQGKFAEIYTSATEAAVSRFQRNHGLIVSGKVDNTTLAELNIPAEKRLMTIAANIPRLALYELGLGDRYVVVNVPAQQIETVTGGRVFSRHNAIVGRPARPTPVVMTPLATVKFNPYWNAPASIVEKDILPKLQGSTQYLEDANIKILQGGQNGVEVDPATLDFANLNPDDYLFRQEPGPHNAMATAKVEFNSPFGIYLHDTPEKQMFNANNRFFSSGCIRVEKMPLLVQWVLNGQDGYGESKIATMAETLERLDVPLASPPQLRVAYLTAWPSAAGTVSFRNDVYQLDGTGFVVGQPMPVGEMSPDGLRFVLKPLPRQQSVDAAEAEGFGLFGTRKAAPGKSLFTLAKADKATVLTAPKKNLFGKTLFAAVPAVTVKPDKKEASTTNKAKGLFDWEAYRKKQALEAKNPKKTDKKKSKAADKKASAATVRKLVNKKLDCKLGADGKLPSGCKPAPTAAADKKV